MRAMVLCRPERGARTALTEETRSDLAPGRGEVVLTVAACGVCRTDLQICEGDLAARRLPIVPGHQIVGRVAAIGAEVSGFTVGDRVGVAWLGGTCETDPTRASRCRFCASGRENLCENARFTGWDRDGGYAEQVVVEAGFALRVPDSFRDLDVAPLLCGGVIGYRALRRANVTPGCRVGLYGFGASAHLAIQVARHWGCRVFVASRSAEDLARARALGAEWTGGYDDPPPEPLDAVVTFAPKGSVVRAALRATARGGTVAINAIHLDAIPEMPYEELWWERSLVSVANFTRKDARELLDLAAAIPIRTHYEVHPLKDANRALCRLREGSVDGAAVIQVAP